jgi:hypothetical protein
MPMLLMTYLAGIFTPKNSPPNMLPTRFLLIFLAFWGKTAMRHISQRGERLAGTLVEAEKHFIYVFILFYLYLNLLFQPASSALTCLAGDFWSKNG